MKSEFEKKISSSMATRLLRVVFGFYLVVVLCSMIGQMFVEYRYQKNSILKEFLNIQASFEQVLAGEIWDLDEKALLSTVKGMIELPVIVGIKIADANGKIIALGGIVNTVNGKGEVGVHVHMQGCAPEEEKFHVGEPYRFEMFEGSFPIIYSVNNERRVLGRATLYSNTSVVFSRVKMSFLMLGVKTIVEIALLWLIFNLVFVRVLKKPLAELTGAVESVTIDNLDTVKVSAPSGCRDELGVLAESFNKMLLDLRSEIAKRKIADQGMRDSEERFRATFDQAAVGIAQVGLDGRWLRVNQRLCDIVGYTSKELLPLTFQDITHPDDLNAGLDYVRQMLDGSIQNYSMEKRYIRKDCTPIWINLTVSMVRDEAGIPKYFVSVVEDISARRHAESEKDKLQAQLIQAQKMESVGRLAGGVAHDFNNMLQSILGNADLALVDLPPESPLRENLEEIQKSAQRSASLTRQLLAFARKQTIAPKVLDLNETVSGMLNMLQRLIGENINMTWTPTANLWPVKMDPGQIDQIMANLCINARDAIANTGKITLETSNVTLDDAYVSTHPDIVPGDYVMLAVSDTGCGMDDETLGHIFEPFFTTKEVGKGTGLGLSTVFGIVQQNRGLINVYSEPGQGMSFKIYLPRATAETVVEAKKTIPQPLHGTETVLLVEDEEQILNLGRRILEQLGYKVLAASTPEIALAEAARHAGQIHLMVTDVVMPGLNGRELRERLQESYPRMKCLYMSGYTANVIAHHGVLDDGVQFLQKPFTIHTLAEKVREVLEQATP